MKLIETYHRIIIEQEDTGNHWHNKRREAQHYLDILNNSDSIDYDIVESDQDGGIVNIGCEDPEIKDFVFNFHYDTDYSSEDGGYYVEILPKYLIIFKWIDNTDRKQTIYYGSDFSNFLNTNQKIKETLEKDIEMNLYDREPDY